MAFGNATAMMKEALVNTVPLNISWLIVAILTFFTLLIITRNAKNWLVLMLPVTIAWHVVGTHLGGLTPSFIQYIIATMLFVIDIFSINTAGQILAVFTGKKRGKSIEEQVIRSEKRRITGQRFRNIMKNTYGNTKLGLGTKEIDKIIREMKRKRR